MKKNSKNNRIDLIIKRLEKEYPITETQLKSGTAFQLLVAVILSAQCTDARVNLVTKELFKKYPTAQDFSIIKQETLEEMIFSTGFYKAKAKNIIAMSKKLIEEYNGEVPDSLEELITLPGVGRKSANVIMGDWFKKPVGIVVDTHVIRISNRLGFVDTKNPEKIEMLLVQNISKEYWAPFTHYLILFGRSICKARSPQCNKCFLYDLCYSKDKI